MGQNVYLEGLSFDMVHYREFAFGIAKQLDEHWNLGATFKYLNGKRFIQTQKSDLFFYTEIESYNTYINGSYSAKTAGVRNNDGSSSDYKLFGNKNHGVVFDIGASYKCYKWVFNASMIDVGFIHWKENSNLRFND